MSKRTQSNFNDLATLADDARALIAATADVAGERVEDARNRLTVALDKGREIYGRVRDKAANGIDAADEAIHDHPYQPIGVALVLGAVIGFFLARRR